MQIEYLENQCIERKLIEAGILNVRCNNLYFINLCVINLADRRCPFSSVPESHPRYLDTVINGVTSEQDCQIRCNTHREFVCRSYAFYAAASQCFISGDDKGSLLKLPISS